MDNPSTRLKRARELTGYDTAQGFADRHNIAGSTQRARESGGRGITPKIAKEYEGYFRQHAATRHVTAEHILYADSKAEATNGNVKTPSIKADAISLIDAMTEEEVHDLWPWLIESAKLVKKAS